MLRKDLWSVFEQECKTPKCIDMDTHVRETCDICQNEVRIGEDGFMVCSNLLCAVLYTDTVDHTAEWRYYGDDHSNPTRCGMPINPLLKESSFGCKVMCDGSASYEMRKIQRYTEWQSMPYKEKSLYEEINRISIMAGNAGISKMLIDEACRHHKDISENQSFRGLNRDGIIAASIYIACRVENCARTAKEIARIFNLDSTSATRGCKNAMSIINEIGKNQTTQVNYASTNPLAFIERYCSKLNMNYELTKVAQFMAVQIDKKNLIPENTPHSVAAGIVFFLSHEFSLGITKRDIQLVSDISEVTVNKCYKKISTLKDQLIPPTIYQKYKK